MIQPSKKLRQINKNVKFTTLNTWYCKIHNFTKSITFFSSHFYLSFQPVFIMISQNKYRCKKLKLRNKQSHTVESCRSPIIYFKYGHDERNHSFFLVTWLADTMDVSKVQVLKATGKLKWSRNYMYAPELLEMQRSKEI